MPAIGVDVGGTKIAIGVLADDGHLYDYAETSLPSRSYAELLDVIAAQVGSRHEAGATPVLGIAMAAWLSTDRETVLRSANLGWDDRRLRADLADRTGLETTVHNDGNCAAWGEYVLAGKPATGATVVLTLGTDVGGGVIVNGRLLTGAFGAAGELGHLRVHEDGPPCVCGSRGCLAVYASGTAMLRRFRERTADSEVTGADFGDAANAGDATALDVVAEAAQAIAFVSAQISRVIDHDVLVLGGGASRIGAPLAQAVAAALDATEPIGPLRPRPVVRLGSNQAGVHGAADLALISDDRSQP